MNSNSHSIYTLQSEFVQVASVTGDHTAFLYNEDFLKYYFGENHPFQPLREKRTMELLEELGVFGGSAITYNTHLATEDDLRLVHTLKHVAFVKETCERGEGFLDRGDTPATKTLFEGSLAAVGASLDGVDGIMKGTYKHAFNPAGGLHHARSDRSAGFCVFNDVAIAVRALQRRHGLKKLAVVDIDGHHGDGTQSVFYDEKILTISLHHYDLGFYPGSGSSKEKGADLGTGYALNIPLPFRTGDTTYLKAYREVVLPALEAYHPEFIIHQFGVDGHFSDPLVGLALTTQGYEVIAKLTHDSAHDMCDGRYLVVGGGGYNPDATKRSWAIMFCTISGVYPKDKMTWDALHDKRFIPEPKGVAEEVDVTLDLIKAELLPLIK